MKATVTPKLTIVPHYRYLSQTRQRNRLKTNNLFENDFQYHAGFAKVIRVGGHLWGIEMDLNGQTANRVVKVNVTSDGLVQLHLDTLLIEMTPENFNNFVGYLQSALPMTEALTMQSERPKLRIVSDTDA